MSAFSELLQEIRSHGFDPAGALEDGASAAEVERAQDALELTFPPTLIEVLTWRSGPKEGQGLEADFLLPPRSYPRSLSAIVRHHTKCAELYPHGWVLVWGEQGGIGVDCDRDSATWGAVGTLDTELGHTLDYADLDGFFRTLATSWDQGVHRLDGCRVDCDRVGFKKLRANLGLRSVALPDPWEETEPGPEATRIGEEAGLPPRMVQQHLALSSSIDPRAVEKLMTLYRDSGAGPRAWRTERTLRLVENEED